MADSSTVAALPAFLTPERVDLALKSSWQLESCAAGALKLLLSSKERAVDPVQVDDVVLALLLRIEKLSQAIMGALGDQGETLDELRHALSGVPHG